MDIIRIKSNNNFRFVNKHTKKKVNKKTLKRVKSLKIPPAYTKVKINCDENAKLQAYGYDDKNRKQYIYHPKFYEESKEIKFEDLLHFARKINRIKKDINRSLSQSVETNIPDKNQVICLILSLIDKCNFRIGNEKYKELYNSYGVTTLNKEHFDIKKNYIVISFIGKKGVKNKSIVNNKYLNFLIIKLINLYGDEDYLFCYKDSENKCTRVTEAQVNSFLKKYHKSLSVKMFRTYNANYLLLKNLLDLSFPSNEKEAKKNLSIALGKAAEALHHSKTVSKNSYMNNKIVDLYLNNYGEFKDILNDFKKTNGELPTTSKMLNKLLKHLVNKKN